MSARIINRGRGPEIEGTRVTVYRVMDYVCENDPLEVIARELELTPVQVQAAVDYIAEHRDAVEADYERILRRVRQPNPEHVEAGRARSPEELKQRIRARRPQATTHPDRVRDSASFGT